MDADALRGLFAALMPDASEAQIDMIVAVLDGAGTPDDDDDDDDDDDTPNDDDDTSTQTGDETPPDAPERSSDAYSSNPDRGKACKAEYLNGTDPGFKDRKTFALVDGPNTSDDLIAQLWGSPPERLATNHHAGAWANAMRGCDMDTSDCLPSKSQHVRYARKLVTDGGENTVPENTIRNIMKTDGEGPDGINHDNIRWMKCVRDDG